MVIPYTRPQLTEEQRARRVKVAMGVIIGVAVALLLVIVPVLTRNPATAVGTFVLIAGWIVRELYGRWHLARQKLARKYLLLLGALLVGAMLAGGALSLLWGVTGTAVIALVMACVVPTDVGAQEIGRRWGDSHLPDWLSKSKTWEGVAGGIATAWLVGLLVFLLVHFFWVSLPWPLVLIVLVGPPLAVASDLLESAVKRRLVIKDMGSSIKGHGGICERADSPALPLLAALVLVAVCL